MSDVSRKPIWDESNAIYWRTSTQMLWDAVHFETMNTAQAKTALDAGANVDGDDIHDGEKHDGTPLISAAHRSNVALIRLLLEREANIAACDSQGRTALMEAATGGTIHVISLLLRHGANIHSRDYDGMTALHYATYGNARVIRALLVAGSDIEARDNKGKTPFLLAAHRGTLYTVRALLQNGADVNARSDNGYSALRWNRQPPHWSDMTEDQWIEHLFQSENYGYAPHSLCDYYSRYISKYEN